MKGEPVYDDMLDEDQDFTGLGISNLNDVIQQAQHEKKEGEEGVVQSKQAGYVQR